MRASNKYNHCLSRKGYVGLLEEIVSIFIFWLVAFESYSRFLNIYVCLHSFACIICQHFH